MTCNLLVYIKYNSATTVTSYWYLNSKKDVTSYYRWGVGGPEKADGLYLARLPRIALMNPIGKRGGLPRLLSISVRWLLPKGGQTAILVRWSAAQRNTEMVADQRTGKNSGLAPADYRNWASASPLLNYLREVILSLKGPLTWEGMVETSCKFRRLSFKKTSFELYHFLPNESRWTVPLIFTIYSRKVYTIEKIAVAE